MAHFAQSPSFILHQVTCQFPTGDTLFGPLNLTLEPSLCALVGRNGSGKTRLLRLLAGLDEPATGHIERFGSHAYVAQQHVISRRRRWLNCSGMTRFLRRVSASTAAITSLTIWIARRPLGFSRTSERGVYQCDAPTV
jgi:ATPase subunit of ABC transporter with duplicated ATPase domains